MKNNIIVIALVIFTSITTNAQNQFAVFGGINNSSISDGFMEKFDFNSKITLHIGALYEYEISNKIKFRPKLVYSQQGDWKKTDNTFIDARSIDYKLSYLNIPLNFKFYNKPYIIFGPQIGFLLSTEKLSSDFGDVENTFDYGVNLGTGYDFNDFFIEFNIYQGLATIIQFDSVIGQQIEVEGKNTVMQLSFGYYFK